MDMDRVYSSYGYRCQPGPQKGNAAEDDLEKHDGEQLAKKEERWGGIPGTKQSIELKKERAGEQTLPPYVPYDMNRQNVDDSTQLQSSES